MGVGSIGRKRRAEGRSGTSGLYYSGLSAKPRIHMEAEARFFFPENAVEFSFSPVSVKLVQLDEYM